MEQFYISGYEDAEVSVPLFDESIPDAGPHVSVVIGPNGSGKSRALSRVAEELDVLYSMRDAVSKRRVEPPSNIAKINYQLDGVRCEISRRGKDVSCVTNGEQSEFFSMPFPRRVAAVSHLPTDKFRFAQGGNSDFYRYLGLRQATNLTTTGALEAKVLQSILAGLRRQNFVHRFAHWLMLTGMSGDVGLTLTIPNIGLLTGDFDDFRGLAKSVATRRYGPGRTQSLESHRDWPHDLDTMWLFFSRLRGFAWSKQGRSASVTLEVMPRLPLFEDVDLWTSGIDAARRWRLFSQTGLVLKKADRLCRFADLSSGEQQLIGTSTRLLAELEPHSLVIIDEPEISLHPEWQIKYIPTLLQSLDGMKSTHVVIATHSHFMVSDIEGSRSALITASGGSPSTFSMFNGDVYGRSPENILYRVFGVATAGNANVERDLYVALQMLSGAMDMDAPELRKIFFRLKRVCGEDNVAMNVIVGRIGAALEIDID